jgi:hypothetical protein
MSAYSKMEVQFHAYLAAVLDNEKWPGTVHVLLSLTLGKESPGPLIRILSLMALRVAMDFTVKREISARA